MEKHARACVRGVSRGIINARSDLSPGCRSTRRNARNDPPSYVKRIHTYMYTYVIKNINIHIQFIDITLGEADLGNFQKAPCKSFLNNVSTLILGLS